MLQHKNIIHISSICNSYLNKISKKHYFPTKKKTEQSSVIHNSIPTGFKMSKITYDAIKNVTTNEHNKNYYPI